MPRSDVLWEGSRGFKPAVRLARALTNLDPRYARGEEVLVGRAMAGMLQEARPVVCPPTQLNAVSDEIFSDLGQAFDYASSARLPFRTVFFDFLDELGRGPAMGVHFVEGGGRELGFELQGVVAGENPGEQETLFLPIIGYPGQPPEEIGATFADWTGTRRASQEPVRWQEQIEGANGAVLEVTLVSVSAAMQALGESPRPVAGAALGVARAGMPDDQVPQFQVSMAALAGAAMRMALKVVYLLDSVNVELARAPVSRQVRRQAERKGGEVAWVVHVRPPHSRERDDETEEEEGSRSFSHRFEVRGNFAHHKAGSWLFERSAPEDIRPCPRCGRCRRVWRQPHIKGPADKPLAIKVRRVDFRGE